MRAAFCGAPGLVSTLGITIWSTLTIGGLPALMLTLLALSFSLLVFAFLLLYTATPYSHAKSTPPSPQPTPKRRPSQHLIHTAD